MSYVSREVARLVSEDSIEIVKQLNHESVDGIADWSHCWLVTVSGEEINLVLCEILGIQKVRQLRLKFLGPMRPGARIIDIKPVHPCDLAGQHFMNS